MPPIGVPPALLEVTAGFAAPLFWLALLSLAYAYAGYPLLIAAWARFRPRPFTTGAVLPTVSILMTAHDEAARIAARLENLRRLDYPPDRLEILVGSDGSTDATAQRARAFEPCGVKVVEFTRWRGKPATLNDLARRAQGEILVFTDARQTFDRQALRALVAPFGDPSVGAVGGELILTPDGTEAQAGRGLGLYWRLEKSIRACESRVASCVGYSGAIAAVRRALFEPLPAEIILDDVLTPMRVARRGRRVVFEPRARAYDRLHAGERQEFARKVRTIAGNFQLFARHPWLLDPRCNPIWWQTISHKVFRLLGPFCLALLGLTSVLLPAAPFYRMALAAQIGFYVSAAAGRATRGGSRSARLAALPYTICLLNWATLVAFVRFLLGRQRVTWKRAAA